MKFSLLLVLLLNYLALYSQQYEVKGTVQDSLSRQPLIGATVAFLQEDQVPLGTTTLADGSFSFTLPAGSYVMRISYIGYREKSNNINLDGPHNFQIIQLAPSLELLEGVEIVNQVQQAQQIGDTTQFNAGAFKTNPDASSEDLLQKMPGVIVTDGKVQAQGEEVKQVLVDGKPFMGNDPSAALRNLPAEVVDRIQIYDAPSEQAEQTGYDDGETRKTINIVTKEEFRNGLFGRLYGGYGTDDRYQAGAVLNHFKDDRRVNVLLQSNNINQQNFANEDLAGVASGGGSRGGGRGGRGGGGGNAGYFMVDMQGGIATTNAAGINFNDQWGEKMEVNGSYFFNQIENQSALNLVRGYTSGQDLSYRENSSSQSLSQNHRFNVRLEYKLSDQSTLRYQPELSLQNNDGSRSLEAVTQNGDSLLGSTSSITRTEFKSYRLNQSLTFRHRFVKKGRSFSFRLQHQKAPTEGEAFLTGLNRYDRFPFVDSLDQLSVLEANDEQLNGIVNYTEPLGERSQLQFNYRHGEQFGQSLKSTRHFELASNDFTLADTLLSSEYSTRFSTRAGGIGLRSSWEKLNLNFNVSLQHASFVSDQVSPSPMLIDYSFLSVLPSARINYKMSKVKNLNFYYRTNTRSPSVRQLQYVVDNSNPLQLYMGNPELDPQYQHSANLRYNSTDTLHNTVFMALIAGEFTNDYIAEHTMLAIRDTLVQDGLFLPEGVELSRPENIGTGYSLRAFSTLGFPVIALRSKLNINISASFSSRPGIFNSVINRNQRPGADLGVVLTSNISEKLDFTISTNTGLSRSINSLAESENIDYLTQNTRVKLYWNFYKTLVYRTDLSHRYISGLAGSVDNTFLLWNMSLGTRLFKKKNAEISVSVFDVLAQNNSISRTVTETYVEDSETITLQRYLMLNFYWNFRKYKSEASAPQTEG